MEPETLNRNMEDGNEDLQCPGDGEARDAVPPATPSTRPSTASTRLVAFS